MMKCIKWGRGLLSAGIAFCVLLCLTSCGSVSKGKNSADTFAESAESTSDNSHAKEEPVSADPIGRLAGRYCIDGDSSAASVFIGTDGSFTAFYASGTIEQTGYVRYETDDTGEKSFHVYVFYTGEGKPYMGFVDSGESIISEFETGNGSYRYVRVE